MAVAFIFPGQGSQFVGMGQALAQAFPEARATLDEANRKGVLKDGQNILMMAIGGGMTWGSALLRW